MENFNYDIFNEYIYIEDFSIEDAKNKLKELVDNKNKGISFDDDIWPILLPLQQIYTYIDFNVLKQKMTKYNLFLKNQNEKINIFKCWCVSILEIYEPTTLKDYVKSIEIFIDITQGIKVLEFEKIIPKLQKAAEYLKQTLYPAVMNLIDYYGNYFESNENEILILLENINNFVDNKKSGIREIPSTLDFLLFDRVVTDYFSKELSEVEYLKWTCVELWWELTTIIPIRTSEFCTLKKDSFIEESNQGKKYYVNIKRVKTGRDKDLYTKVAVPEKLYLKFKKYINFTSKYDDNCETIFSKAIISPLIHNRNVYNLFHEFSARAFMKVLVHFYEEIVCRLYGYTELKNSNRRLRPNDTRHLAFINLKLQGVHPVIVAQMGGHLRISTQEHYFSHIKNMMDLELLALLSINKVHDVNFLGKSIIDEHVLKPAENEKCIPLEIGYCTDSEMNCLVKYCWQGCSSWRIKIDDLKKHKDKIEETLILEEQSVNQNLTKINKLFNDIISSYKDKHNESDFLNEVKKLTNASSSLISSIVQFITVNDLIKRVE